MVRIRFRRVGAKGQPSYRVVAADKESPRDGRFLEILGYYNPRTEPATIQLKEDRIFDWMSKGAQPTESVSQVFRTAGLTERFELYKKGESLEKLPKEADAAETSTETSTETSAETSAETSTETSTETSAKTSSKTSPKTRSKAAPAKKTKKAKSSDES